MLDAPARYGVAGFARSHDGGVLYDFRVFEMGVASEMMTGGIRILSSPRIQCAAGDDAVPSFVQFALAVIAGETPEPIGC